MDLKDMILVTENDRGTETNMLMTLDDYKSFIAVDDMSELADNLLQLGRTLGEAENFAEYYRAANVTLSARFCLDDIQLGHFLQSFVRNSIPISLMPMQESRNRRKRRHRSRTEHKEPKVPLKCLSFP